MLMAWRMVWTPRVGYPPSPYWVLPGCNSIEMFGLQVANAPKYLILKQLYPGYFILKGLWGGSVLVMLLRSQSPHCCHAEDQSVKAAPLYANANRDFVIPHLPLFLIPIFRIADWKG
jgi:hypothetical protein